MTACKSIFILHSFDIRSNVIYIRHSYSIGMNASKQLTVRLPEMDILRVEAGVKNGHAMNVADFIRRSVREKCDELGIILEPEKQTQVVFSS